MFARLAVLSFALLLPLVGKAKAYSINASGRGGYDGSAGENGYNDDRSRGRNGRPGENGTNGGDAGDVNVFVSYADASKTTVHIRAEILFPGQNPNITDEIVPLAELDSIQVVANGGNGGSGGDGGRGGEGADGARGRDGCPAGHGQDGGQGGHGGYGGSGGHGGRAGQIRVVVPDSQTELSLLVATLARGGSGGGAGSGGSGRSGGSGGLGGDSTCRDSSGARVGQDGSSGSSGPDGHSGQDGEPGSPGQSFAAQFQVSSPAGNQYYDRSFQVRVSDLQITDTNGDGVVEPGETVEVRQLTIINPAPMPLPAGQVVDVHFASSKALEVVRAPTVSVTERLAMGALKTLTFGPGEFVLRASKELALADQRHALGFSVTINALHASFGSDATVTIARPVRVDAQWKGESLKPYFTETLPLSLRVKNLTQKPLGVSGRPARLWLEWAGRDVEGRDVTVKLADGRELNLGQRVETELPALAPGQTSDVAIQLTLANPKALAQADASLRYGVSIAALEGQGFTDMQNLVQAVDAAQDFRSVAFEQSLDLRKLGVKCTFPAAGAGAWDISYLKLKKAAGSDKTDVTVWTGSWFSRSQSPVFQVQIHDMAASVKSMGVAGKGYSAQEAAAFLTKAVAPATQAAVAKWQVGACSATK